MIELVELYPLAYAVAFESEPRTVGLAWTAVEYLWHVVDVVRLGTDRIWALAVDPVRLLVPWDPDQMAEARTYRDQSIPVGLHALSRAARDWSHAARRISTDARVPHPEWGTIGVRELAQRTAHELHHHLDDITSVR